MKSGKLANVGFALALVAALLCFGIFFRNPVQSGQYEPQALIAGFFILFMAFSLWRMGKSQN